MMTEITFDESIKSGAEASANTCGSCQYMGVDQHQGKACFFNPPVPHPMLAPSMIPNQGELRILSLVPPVTYDRKACHNWEAI